MQRLEGRSDDGEDDDDDGRIGPPALSSSTSSSDNNDDDEDEDEDEASGGSGSGASQDAGVGFFLTEFDHRNPTDQSAGGQRTRKPGRLTSAGGDGDDAGSAHDAHGGRSEPPLLPEANGAAELPTAEARFNDCVALQARGGEGGGEGGGGSIRVGSSSSNSSRSKP